MTGRVLLLDVDGVVLHQPQLLSHVSRKIIQYVKRNIPRGNNVNMMEAAKINEMLYKSYGHTHRGMEKVYGCTSVPSLEHFQKTIYDEETIRYLWTYRTDPMMHKRGQEILHLMDKASKWGIPVYLFSNAPLSWCRNVSDMLQLDIIDDHIFCNNHPVFQETLLKPDTKLYEHVATFLHHTHRDQGISDIIFVDDSWSNLVPVIGNNGWNPILFAEECPPIASKWIKAARSVGDVIDLL